MLGKIISINENIVEISLSIEISKVGNLINYHVIFEDGNVKSVGEINSLNATNAFVTLIGEINGNIFLSGITKKPPYGSGCRIINKDELDIVVGNNSTPNEKRVFMGKIPLYDNYPISVNINNFFSNHFSLFGNTGSGKSYSVSTILQSVLYNKDYSPTNSNILIFDAYGEYHHCFDRVKEYSPDLNFKIYTTKVNFPDAEVIKIPLWLLGVDDLALLLEATNHTQLPIIEKALRLVTIFAKQEDQVIVYKNDIIARALIEILYSGSTPSQIRDQIFAILSSFNTKDLSLDSKIVQPGYTRTLRQCLIIDKDGKLVEMQLINEFFSSFVKEGLELKLPDGSFEYTLEHLRVAFDFALISEGILKSDKVYDYSNILKVRLHSLINSDYHTFFTYDKYITKEDYIRQLMTTSDGKRAQVVNFNINYLDDRFAKIITKIFAKLFYDYVTELDHKTSFPINIILEEAHRYVQNDNDAFLLGYNIFDRISKEGRKYGIMLGLISQRPSELSETFLSQCSNFIVFRMVHPRDLGYIRDMVPNITDEILNKLKTLRPGTAIAFGTAFQIPVIIKFDEPNPAPNSSSADIGKEWYKKDNLDEQTLLKPTSFQPDLSSSMATPNSGYEDIKPQNIEQPTIL
ncbi:MAG: ATP-binding protein [Bacilli bacterium]|nr:ATP-binding protein [Bacilli bacterium]